MVTETYSAVDDWHVDAGSLEADSEKNNFNSGYDINAIDWNI